VRAASALLAAVALAGCGGASGHAIFVRDCAGCHSLDGREVGAPGGDLVLAHLDVRDLASFARTMPVRPRLTERQAAAVAAYVHAVTERESP
jgi:mono/diheme cytochrome c family protein